MNLKRLFLYLIFLFTGTTSLLAQHPVSMIRMNRQHHFKNKIPAGNYSGISRLNDSLYAVVSDKSAQDGFFLFRIRIDSITGDIIDVDHLGFKGQTILNRDEEGIAYRPDKKTLLISGEKDQDIVEYDLDGNRTGREATIPDLFRTASTDYGMEALAYEDSTRTLWTCTECPLPIDTLSAPNAQSTAYRIRIQAFNDSLQPIRQYAYQMDLPQMRRKKALHYVMGISELTSLSDGSLLVLEREFYVPRMKLGASVRCKIYQIFPDPEAGFTSEEQLTASSPFLPKQLVCQWKTRLGLFSRSLANYEGMCVGPRLADGSQTLILISDSQNQYAGVLKDWFRTIVIR